MTKKQRITFYLTDQEYIGLKQKAEECGIGVNAYAKQKALDETDTVKLRRGAAFTMAELYRWADLTVDPAAQEYLRKGGNLLCQFLK